MEDSKYKTHLFICTNAPDRKGKCGNKNSEELRLRLKKRCGESFGSDVRVNSSGCLGHCEHGIAAVLYPQNQWFLELQANPESENILFEAVKSALENGK